MNDEISMMWPSCRAYLKRVIRIFTNEASLIRLIGAMFMEQDEKWSTGKKYLSMEEYYQFRTTHQSLQSLQLFN